MKIFRMTGLFFVILLFVLILVKAQQSTSFDGTLYAIIGDSESFQEDPVVKYYLFSDNDIYEIIYSGEIPQNFIGSNVQVQGVISGSIITAVDINLMGSVDGGLLPIGPQRTISFLVKFNDLSNYEPQPNSYFANLVFGNNLSLKTLWEENSYNALTVVNNGTYGWLILPQTQAQYNMLNTTFPNSGNLFALLNDAISVAYNNGIQLEDNTRILVFVNNLTGCCGWGSLGSFSVITPYGSRTISASWLPIWAYNNNPGLHVVGHEYGHNIGFWHSGNVYAPYDSPWDTVSAGCNPEGAHTITKNKADSGWLTGSDFINILSTQALQTTIYPTTNTNGLRGVKITTPDPNIYFTIESRINQGHDNCLPNQGVIIHKVNLSLGDWNAKPIDATPGDNDLSNAQWNIGQTYNDSNYQFNIQVISSQPNGGTLIRVAPQGTSSSQCSTITSPGYYALSNSVFSPGTCFTINSDNVNLDCQWNTITYGTSSQGNGVTASNRNNVVVQNCFINQGTPIQYSDAISFDQVHQAQVLNSIINTLGHDSRGIYDLGNSQVRNHVYENNVINTLGVRSYGVDITSGGDNIIRLNNITTNGNQALGMIVSTNTINTFVIVSENNVTTRGYLAQGVELAGKDINFTFNNVVTLGNIFPSGTQSHALSLGGYSNAHNYVADNRFTTFGSNSNGINLWSGGGNTITRNSIKTFSPANANGIFISAGGSPSPNLVYNNLLNTSGNNVGFGTSINNYWNTTYQQKTNIVGGPYLGGNFYAKTDGTGFSDNCQDLNFNGICDNILQHDTNNIDYLPLAKKPPVTMTIQGNPRIGSTINISLFDSYHPGLYYILGASLATQPSIIIGPPYALNNITVPLAFDFVFNASVFNPLSIGLSHSQGFFNQNGEEVATLQIPNISSIAGTTVYFAFATFNITAPIPQTIVASEAVPVTLLP